MKIKIKRIDGSEHQFDDVVNISIETVEVIPIKKESQKKTENTQNKKQIYVCNEFGNWAIDIVRETEKAFLVNTGEKEVWLPKSKIVENRINEKDFNYFVNKK